MATGGRAAEPVDVVDPVDLETAPPPLGPDADRAPSARRRRARAVLALAVVGGLLVAGELAREAAPPPAARAGAAVDVPEQTYQDAVEAALAVTAPGLEPDWRLGGVVREGSRRNPPKAFQRTSPVVSSLPGTSEGVRVLRTGYRVAEGVGPEAEADPCAAPVVEMDAWPTSAGAGEPRCTVLVDHLGERWAVRSVRRPTAEAREAGEGLGPARERVVSVRSVTLVLGDWSCSVSSSLALGSRAGRPVRDDPAPVPLTTHQLQEVARALAAARSATIEG